MSEEELYNNIVEILSKGDFLQINGKPINLKELNDYINSQQQEIERLHSIIKEVRGKLYDLNYKIKEIHNVPFDISEIFEIIDYLNKEE